MASVLKASAWSFAANWGQQLISTGTFLFLAYQLQASDFGIVALAAAVVDLFTVIARFGQVEALLQHAETSEEHISSSFWLLVAIGFGLTLAIIILGLASPYLYDDMRVETILFLLAPIPIIQNIAIIHEYHLRRRLEYRGIAVRNISATFLSGLASISLAYWGFGYYALVAQKLIFTAVNSLALILYLRWKPGFVLPNAGYIRKLARAGFNVSSSNMIGMANGRIIDLFVGHFLGVVALGNLRIAWRLFDLLLQFVVQPITTVAVSSFTRLRTYNEIKGSVLDYISVLSSICFPLFVGASVFSTQIMVVMLGQKWGDSGWILGYLCLSAFALPINNIFTPSIIATKKTDILRNQSIMQLVFTSVTVAISTQFNLPTVILIHVTRVYLFTLVYLYILKRDIDLGFQDVLLKSIGPLVATAAMFAALYAMQNIGNRDNLILLIVEIAVAALTYLLVVGLGEYLGFWSGNAAATIRLIQRKIGKI